MPLFVFFAGLICHPDISRKRYRYFGIIALSVAVIGICLWGNDIPASFLYHSTNYGTLKNGFALRLFCYGIGGLLDFFLLTNMSGKRYPFTKAGANTMPQYLICTPLVACLREL